MEQFDANDLLLFATIVEAGNFSRAAERLRLPASTLSRRLTALENRLGERLLVRTTRKLNVSDFGLAILEHARQIADEVDAIGTLAQSRQARPSGRLRVSMPSDLANQLLAPMLAQFIRDYPEVELQIDLSPRRVDLIAEGYDLAIRVGALADDATLVARRIWFYSPMLYAAPAYLEKTGTPRVPADLEDLERLCLLGRDQRPLDWRLRRNDEEWLCQSRASASINSPEVLTRLAVAGLGIVATAQMFAAPFAEKGLLVRVLPEWHLAPVNIWAVYPGRRLLPAKVRIFLDLLEAWLRPGG